MNLQQFYPYFIFGNDIHRSTKIISENINGKNTQVDVEAYLKDMEKADTLDHPQIDKSYLDIFNDFPFFGETFCNCFEDKILIQSKNEIKDISTNKKEMVKLKSHLKKMIPWRKGPFDIFGIYLDTEWRSEKKWNRLKEYLPDLKNKVIGDLGSNSGYYLFKMAAHQPALVLGFDPVLKFKLQFEYLQNFIQRKEILYNMLGWQALVHFDSFFDIIFNMGIIYHHRSPIEILDLCYKALKPGGTLILESMAISSKKDFCLSPGKRYCGTPGVWFIPSESVLTNWLSRTRFIDINITYCEKLSIEEQRSTSWAPFESLKDFLDKNNPSVTVEGYEAPSRIIIFARKPGKIYNK